MTATVAAVEPVPAAHVPAPTSVSLVHCTPSEARGLTRDAVRMMVATECPEGPRLVHSTFALLPSFLEPGDLVVVNTSGTIPAAVVGSPDVRPVKIRAAEVGAG